MQKLQCEICGGSLIMAEDGEGAVCESCGMRFKKEAVKKMVMELSGPIKIDGPVQIEGMENASTLAVRAADFEKLNLTDSAHKVYREMTEKYPGDYRGWWGLARACQVNLQLPQLERALKLAPEEIKPEIQKDIRISQTQQACEMADRIYIDYAERVKALQNEEDARAEVIAETKARIAGMHKENELSTGTAKTRRVVSICFAAFALLCFVTAHYIFGALGALLALMTFAGSFSQPASKHEILELEAKLTQLEKESGKQGMSKEATSIPVPDGSESPDPAAFQKRINSLIEADAEKRKKRLAELPAHYEHLIRLETIGREIAEYCNKQPLKQVCDTLQIQHLYFGRSYDGYQGDFVKSGKRIQHIGYGAYRFLRFVNIYGNVIVYAAEEDQESRSDKEDWVNAGVATGRCEIYVDEHNYRNLFEHGK